MSSAPLARIALAAGSPPDGASTQGDGLRLAKKRGSSSAAVATEPCGYVTREEVDAFLASRGGMTAGWTGSFDQLEPLLAAPA